MELGKHRGQWQKLCDTRVEDAEVLIRNGRHAGAYYLAGYAVECALKAKVASLMKEDYFPPKPEYVRKKLYTHSLENLLDVAELKKILEDKAKTDTLFADQWGTVKEWSEDSRYDTQDQKAAEDMLKAVHEVVECIRKYW